MGSGTSRGKKVAPACVSEVNVTKTTTGVTSPKEDSRPFKPLQIHAMLRNARNNRAQPDCHSEGQDSDFSREDEDIDGEMDTFLTDCKERGRAVGKTSCPKKTVIRSKTYGLCHFTQQEDEEPRGSHGGSRDASSQGFFTRGAFLEAVPTSEKQSTFGSCHSSSPTMPVILYDGSEEELMETIEKEFS